MGSPDPMLVAGFITGVVWTMFVDALVTYLRRKRNG